MPAGDQLEEWYIPGLFFFTFMFSTVSSQYAEYKISPMTGFEPQTSSIGSGRSANWATTTARDQLHLLDPEPWLVE